MTREEKLTPLFSVGDRARCDSTVWRDGYAGAIGTVETVQIVDNQHAPHVRIGVRVGEYGFAEGHQRFFSTVDEAPAGWNSVGTDSTDHGTPFIHTREMTMQERGALDDAFRRYNHAAGLAETIEQLNAAWSEYHGHMDRNGIIPTLAGYRVRI